jgi:hypothetical protein
MVARDDGDDESPNPRTRRPYGHTPIATNFQQRKIIVTIVITVTMLPPTPIAE